MKIGLGINLFNNQTLSSLGAEYQAILTVARTNNYTLPSPTEQLLQDQLIVDLKKNGLWAKFDAFYMFANSIYDSNYIYSGSAFARINWKNPTQNYGIAPSSPGILPTITAAAGFTGNGSTMGINLQFPANTGTNFASPNASFGIMLGTVSTTTGSPIIGASGLTNNYNRIRQNGTSSVASNPFAAKVINDNDFIYLTRNGNAVANAGQYVNGIRTAPSGSAGSFINDTLNFYVLRYGDTGSGYSNSQVKIAFIGGDISATTPINLPLTFNTVLKDYITNLNLISSFATYAAMAKEMQYTVL
jgi:hypothetical protein